MNSVKHLEILKHISTIKNCLHLISYLHLSIVAIVTSEPPELERPIFCVSGINTIILSPDIN